MRTRGSKSALMHFRCRDDAFLGPWCREVRGQQWASPGGDQSGRGGRVIFEQPLPRSTLFVDWGFRGVLREPWRQQEGYRAPKGSPLFLLPAPFCFHVRGSHGGHISSPCPSYHPSLVNLPSSDITWHLKLTSLVLTWHKPLFLNKVFILKTFPGFKSWETGHKMPT